VHRGERSPSGAQTPGPRGACQIVGNPRTPSHRITSNDQQPRSLLQGLELSPARSQPMGAAASVRWVHDLAQLVPRVPVLYPPARPSRRPRSKLRTSTVSANAFADPCLTPPQPSAPVAIASARPATDPTASPPWPGLLLSFNGHKMDHIKAVLSLARVRSADCLITFGLSFLDHRATSCATTATR